jgi:predicted MFS family arabinose efflux permease
MYLRSRKYEHDRTYCEVPAMSTTPVPMAVRPAGGPRPRRDLRYPVLLVLLTVCVAVSAVPTPLYAIYAELWGYPPVTTTLVFAAYAVGALASVLLSGPVSDRFGRRPVLLVALVLVLVGLGLFVAADGVAHLVLARLLHGLGIGAAVVAGGAALLDLRPGSAARTGTWNGIAFTVGIGLGALGTAAAAQWDLAPLIAPFLVAAGLVAVLLVLVLAMREPGSPAGGGARVALVRPGVPASVRARFALAATGVAAAWGALGVFLSLEPGIATAAVHASGPLFAGAVVGVFAGAAAVAQGVGARFPARRVAVVGDIATAALLLVCLGAFAVGDRVLVLGAATLLGAAYGLAFGGALRHLMADIPAASRGAVTSAFYLVAYGAMIVATVLAGTGATVWSPAGVLVPFSVLAALVSVGAAVQGIRAGADRPRTGAACVSDG